METKCGNCYGTGRIYRTFYGFVDCWWCRGRGIIHHMTWPYSRRKTNER